MNQQNENRILLAKYVETFKQMVERNKFLSAIKWRVLKSGIIRYLSYYKKIKKFTYFNDEINTVLDSLRAQFGGVYTDIDINDISDDQLETTIGHLKILCKYFEEHNDMFMEYIFDRFGINQSDQPVSYVELYRICCLDEEHGQLNAGCLFDYFKNEKCPFEEDLQKYLFSPSKITKWLELNPDKEVFDYLN